MSSQQYAQVSIVANYTATESDFIIHASAITNNVTVTLPLINDVNNELMNIGVPIRVIRIDNSATYTLTVVPQGTDTILSSSTSYTINVGDIVEFIGATDGQYFFWRISIKCTGVSQV